jgi:hypothetical protein
MYTQVNSTILMIAQFNLISCDLLDLYNYTYILQDRGLPHLQRVLSTIMLPELRMKLETLASDSTCI